MSAIRVCSFESRRSEEMETLIRKLGGVPTLAPSMREVPREANPQVFEFMEKLLAGQVDVMIFLTGVGASTLLDTLELRYTREQLFAALEKITVIVRGPKPQKVLRDWNVRIDHKVPEPNTWEELLVLLDSLPATNGGHWLQDKRLAVQEYGRPNDRLYQGLRERGATVQPVPVYAWELPADTAPLQSAIERAVQGEFEVFLFTSAQQIRHVLEFAERLQLRQLLLQSMSQCRIYSIGPTCSEALREEGLPVTAEASPPKMGPLVKLALQSD